MLQSHKYTQVKGVFQDQHQSNSIFSRYPAAFINPALEQAFDKNDLDIGYWYRSSGLQSKNLLLWLKSKEQNTISTLVKDLNQARVSKNLCLGQLLAV